MNSRFIEKKLLMDKVIIRNATRNSNSVTIDETKEYWTYTWDFENRLIEVQQFNAPDNAQNVKVEYNYDAMNRRIERISYTGETAVKNQYAYGRNGAITYQKKTVGNIFKTVENPTLLENENVTNIFTELMN